MNLKEKSIRGLVWSAVQGWGGQALAIIVFALLARLLDPSAFGLIAMANVFVALTTVFIDQGFAMAIIQRRDLHPGHLDTAFWTNILVGLFLMCLGFLFASNIAQIYGEPRLEPIIRWLSVVFLLNSFAAVQQALLKRALEFKKLAVRSLAASVVGGTVGISMAVLGYGVWSLVCQQIVYSIVQVSLLWIISKWRPGLNTSVQYFKDLFAYGANIVGINLTEFFSRNTDKFVIGYFLGPVSLGYYAVAYKLLESLTLLFSSVSNQVAFSSFSAMQLDQARIRNAFYAATRFTSSMTFPMFIGLAVLAPNIVTQIFGAQWQASIPVIQILVFAGILESVYLFNANVMLAMGKPSWRLKINLLNALVNVVGFVIAVKWGIAAVAAAYVLRAYLLSPIPLVLVRKLIDIRLSTYFASYGVPVFASAVMALGVYFANLRIGAMLSPAWAVTLLIALGMTIYFATVAIISPSLLRDARDVIQGGLRSKGE